jgi:hypothetical protein
MRPLLLCLACACGAPTPPVTPPDPPSLCEQHLDGQLESAQVDLELHLMPADEITELVGAELPGVGEGVGGAVHFVRFELEVPKGFPTKSALAFQWLHLHGSYHYSVARFDDETAVDLLLGGGVGSAEKLLLGLAFPVCLLLELHPQRVPTAVGKGCVDAIDKRTKVLSAEEDRERAARRAKVDGDAALAAAHDKLRSFASPATYPLIEGTYRGHVIFFSHTAPKPKPKIGLAIAIRSSSKHDGRQSCSRRRLIQIEARGQELVAGVKRTIDVGGD